MEGNIISRLSYISLLLTLTEKKASMNKCKNNCWVFIRSYLAIFVVSSSYVLMDIMLCNSIIVSYEKKKEKIMSAS